MRALAALLSLSIALTTLPTLASEADAKDLFARGRELRAKGDCAGAAPLFKKASELWPQGLGSLRNLAECEEQLGHFASSRRAWLDLKRAVLVSSDAKYAGWDADADAAATRLAPKVARLTISLETKGEGTARVFVNKEPIDSKLLDVALDRDPGTYVVRVEGGKEPAEEKVTLVAGDSRAVKLKVDFPESDAAQPPAPPPATPQTPFEPKGPTSSTPRAIGWVALGVGGAAAIGTGIFIAVRASAKSDFESACPDYQTQSCPSAARDPYDRGKSAATLTNVFGAMAIVGLATGVVILATTPAKRETPRTLMRVAPWASAGGGGAFFSGEF